MPIKKRRTLPTVNPSIEQKDAGFREPGRPLSDLVKKYDAASSDAAWDGDLEEADRLQSIADRYRERLADGELWEPDH